MRPNVTKAHRYRNTVLRRLLSKASFFATESTATQEHFRVPDPQSDLAQKFWTTAPDLAVRDKNSALA
jgi:hypothetical protein